MEKEQSGMTMKEGDIRVMVYHINGRRHVYRYAFSVPFNHDHTDLIPSITSELCRNTVTLPHQWVVYKQRKFGEDRKVRPGDVMKAVTPVEDLEIIERGARDRERGSEEDSAKKRVGKG